jgi:molybdopterin molybdotransferase
MALLSVSHALEKLLAMLTPVGVETIPFSTSAGRVLARDIQAPIPLPVFSNSAMDGYAVHVSDLSAAAPGAPVELPIVADIPAGRYRAEPLLPGQAARIMTGAPLPPGAEAVLPVEDTDAASHGNVKLKRSVIMNQNVRLSGEDVRQQETVLKAGTRLRPQEIGFLAMLGIGEISVFRRPRVGVLSTGDELVPVGLPLTPGKIYNSNAPMIQAQLASAGAETLDIGSLPDQPDAIRSALDRAVAGGVDLIVSSAGVSVGAFDYVRAVLESAGRLEFWKVNMRPGRPLAVGVYGGTPFIGLPGNPVSAFVGFEVFVRPAVQKIGGQGPGARPTLWVTVLDPIPTDGRESYLRVSVTREGSRWVARLPGSQGSGNLRSLVQANALLIVPSEVKSPPIGAELPAWWLD